MILIANDIGSKELQRYFAPYEIETKLTELDYADFVFYGNGIDGPCSVGIERKTIGFYTTEEGHGRFGTDLVSSLRSNRLSGHQLRGLFGDCNNQDDYPGYDYVVFLLEGVWKVGEQGEIIVPAGRAWIPMRQGNGRPVSYREVISFLMTLKFVCGGYVERTGGPAETAAFIVALYKWFQKDFLEHKSHEAIYAPEPQGRGRRGSFSAPKCGPVEVVSAQFPGVARKAFEFGKVFRTVHEMVNAEPERLGDVEGVGKKGASKIWNWLRGR